MLDRRELLKAGGAAFLASGAMPLSAAGNTYESTQNGGEVKLRGDGLWLSPGEYSALLAGLTADGSVEPDYYSNGGVVAEMEADFAAVLGKERAVFFPTGTLANHLAIRQLAGNDRRVILQETSHIYNDSGDCLETLSSLTPLPLAMDRATFTLEEVADAIARTGRGRVSTPIGVISIECPVRRRFGEVFDFEQMKRIAALAREKGIRMHLDGARLFIASAYTGVPVAEYTALFDTVYVSLWKYFNAASGAVLAGPAKLLDGIYHLRRLFGGGLPYAWPFAAVAKHFLDGFEERFASAVAKSEQFFKLVNAIPGFEIRRIENGTNISRLHLDPGMDPTAFRSQLAEQDVSLQPPAADFHGFMIVVNETFNRTEPERLAGLFKQAAS